MMKDLLWAESQKLHRSKILWIAGFATVMVGFVIVFADKKKTLATLIVVKRKKGW